MPMNEQAAAAMERYSDELLDLLHTHIERRPPPAHLEAVWRLGFAMLLAEMVRTNHLLADDAGAYIADVCEGLRTVATELIRAGDACGWGSLSS